MKSNLTRREMLAGSSMACLTNLPAPGLAMENSSDFQFRYLLGACLYGYVFIEEILQEVRKTGATSIDIWPKPHGNQREQLDVLGEDLFRELLQKHQVTLGCVTQYKLGPFGLQNEMRIAERFGCQTVVCGGRGPIGLKGAELKTAVSKFVEQMKPHLAVAEETGVTIAIENHGNNLIDSPDSLKYLAELSPSKHLSIALAPYHLPQNPQLIAQLIKDLGASIGVFYAWEHGDGCSKKLPKAQELKQMPGRGPLDFRPIVAALVDIAYSGWTEIFMHPVPRGIPILETAAAVTVEINRSRAYLESLVPSAN